MSIPTRLTSYLDQHGVRYEVCTHQHSHTSAETARTAHVPAHQLAKSVILEDDAGCVMAVVPADRRVMVGQLSRMLDRHDLRLSDERRIAMLFGDCVRGAVPPVGPAWGIETVVDDELDDSDVVYMEGGDHECLLRMSREQFHELMNGTRHGHFCKSPAH